MAAYRQPEYQEVTLQPSAAELQSLAAEVTAEIQQMKTLCSDAERNVPLPRDAFPLTEAVELCRHCQFRRLCDREDDDAGQDSTTPVLE